MLLNRKKFNFFIQINCTYLKHAFLYGTYALQRYTIKSIGNDATLHERYHAWTII